MTLRNVTAYQS